MELLPVFTCFLFFLILILIIVRLILRQAQDAVPFMVSLSNHHDEVRVYLRPKENSKRSNHNSSPMESCVIKSVQSAKSVVSVIPFKNPTRYNYVIFIVIRNSALVFVFASLFLSNSMASTGFISLSTFRSSHIRLISSAFTINSSFLVPER